jgi:16S rRNA (guanine527-N7)-methyltransferase
MLQHERLLQAWNPRINLTRIVEPREVAERHFGEALFLAREAQLSGLVADLGAGAGFPGLPIAAMEPQIAMLEVESVAKKATFLREAARDWGNVRVSPSRIEDLKGAFDWVIMRAVAIEPLARRLAELAPRAALLAHSRSGESLERDGLWRVVRRISLPWDGPGELLIVERTDLRRST